MSQTAGETGAVSVSGPHEAVIPGSVPLRGLWWGPLDAVDGPMTKIGAPATLLLHGVGDGADIWRPMMAAWPQDGSPRTFLALDLPGHSGSASLAPQRYRIGELARVVGDVLERLAIERPVLVGHSLGARVVLELVGALGLQPTGIILIDMGIDDNAEVEKAVADYVDMMIAGAPTLAKLVEAMAERLPLADTDAVSHAMASMTVTDGGGVRVGHDPAIKALIADKSDADSWSMLRGLAEPAGLIRGAYSSAVSKATAEIMLASLPRPCGLETILRAGHAIPLEQPAALAEVLYRMSTRLSIAQ